MESLKDQLAALKEKRARLLAEVDEEIRLVKLKIADEVEGRRSSKEAERKTRYEAMLRLHEEGKSIAQIAATVGISQGMVRVVVDRAKRKKRAQEYMLDLEQARRDEEARRDRERTITIVATRHMIVDGEHMDEGAQVRVTPFVAGRLVKANRANFATKEDYEAFMAAVKGEKPEA